MTLRVLFVTSTYPSVGSPVDSIFIREHARAASGHAEVAVLHGPRFDPTATWPRWQEVTDETITAGLPTFELTVGPSPIPKTHAAVRLGAMLFALRELKKRHFVPDIIHAQLYDSGLVAAVMARALGIPMVITEHLSGFPRFLLSPQQLTTARLAYAAAEVVMPVSRALWRGIEANRVHANVELVPNAIDTDLFRSGPRRNSKTKRLVFVGSLRPVKGLDTLLPALALMERTDWRLDIVGDGPRRKEYERFVNELGLAKRVTFVGTLLKPGLADLLRKAHAFVLPSLWENQPCALLEAMSCGLPVVTTTAGGIPELLGPQEGLLCAPRDVAVMSAAVSQMLDSWGEYDRRRIRARVESGFSMAVVGDKLADIYKGAQRRYAHRTPLRFLPAVT